MIEITRDGKWLYWASPTGPLYRAETRYLKDESLTDLQLLQHVEKVFDNNFSGGCSMDSLGNVYFSETATHTITALSPNGATRVLVTDKRLNRPDGTFISQDRHFYIPEKVPLDKSDAPYAIFMLTLPMDLAGLALGGSVSR